MFEWKAVIPVNLLGVKTRLASLYLVLHIERADCIKRLNIRMVYRRNRLRQPVEKSRSAGWHCSARLSLTVEGAQATGQLNALVESLVGVTSGAAECGAGGDGHVLEE